MKFVLTLITLLPLLGVLGAEEAKQSHFIDENALKAILDLAQQTKPTNPLGVQKIPTTYPYLSQNERLTLQGERQTNYPLHPLNSIVDYTLLPQQPVTGPSPSLTQVQTPKDTLVDVKPIYIAYPGSKPQSALTQAAFQALAGLQALSVQAQPKPKPNLSGEQEKPALSIVLTTVPPKSEQKPVAPAENVVSVQKPLTYDPLLHPNFFALNSQASSNPVPAQQARPEPYPLFTSPNLPHSFIIINPTSFHYYPIANYTIPNKITTTADTIDPTQTDEELPSLIKDLSLENLQSSVAALPLEIQPLISNVPNSPTNEQRLIAQDLLEQTHQSDGHSNLLELLKRDQQNRRLQEQVAAFFFRNFNLNKK